MKIETQAVKLQGDDCEGVLVIRDGAVVAVVAKLGSTHGEDEGSWFTEATFGIDARPKTHPDLASACAEIEVLLLAADLRRQRV